MLLSNTSSPVLVITVRVLPLPTFTFPHPLTRLLAAVGTSVPTLVSYLLSTIIGTIPGLGKQWQLVVALPPCTGKACPPILL